MNSRVIHGLLWREWILHHVSLAWIFSAWLFGVWVFPIHPLGFLLPFGILSALMIAPSFGGSDASEGSEEFSFSLPPTRSQRYLIRLALGGGILATLLIVGALAAAFDFPQRVWGLLFESGFTVPFSSTEHDWVYVLACVLPIALFSECFAAGASCRAPEAMGTIWLRGLLITGILVGFSFFVEAQVWRPGVNGRISIPALGLWGLVRLVYGYRDYKYKEGVSGLPRLIVKSRSGFWVTLIVITLIVVAAVFYFLLMARPAPAPMMEN